MPFPVRALARSPAVDCDLASAAALTGVLLSTMKTRRAALDGLGTQVYRGHLLRRLVLKGWSCMPKRGSAAGPGAEAWRGDFLALFKKATGAFGK